MIPTELPDRPWQKLAADLFELKGQTFLLVVDYFLRYVEVAKLTRTTSPDIVVHLKSMFARHGISDQLVSDNGPQFSSKRIRPVRRRVCIYPHDDQPKVSTSEWRSGTRSLNSETPA